MPSLRALCAQPITPDLRQDGYGMLALLTLSTVDADYIFLMNVHGKIMRTARKEKTQEKRSLNREVRKLISATKE